MHLKEDILISNGRHWDLQEIGKSSYKLDMRKNIAKNMVMTLLLDYFASFLAVASLT